MDETAVSPTAPEAPAKKSRLGCIIAGVLGVGCLGALVVFAIVAFLMMRGSRTLGNHLPAPEASVAPSEASPELPSDLGTPSAQETPDAGGETSAPLVATPIQSGSLDQMLDNVANEPQMANSRTDATLRRDVLRQIITSLSSSGCTFSVHGTRVVDGPDARGAWKEVWDLSICGQERHLRIGLTPSASGGTDFTVKE
jgi:hypothetical protein